MTGTGSVVPCGRWHRSTPTVLRPGTPLCRTEHEVGQGLGVGDLLRYLELRHKVEIYDRTGHLVECPLDELNRPASGPQVALRIPPAAEEIQAPFSGWRTELVTCRKYATAARSSAAARLMSQVGLRINELIRLNLADVHWDLGTFRPTSRPARQGQPRTGSQGPAGVTDQRRPRPAAVVRRGCLRLLRCRPRHPGRAAVSLRNAASPWVGTAGPTTTPCAPHSPGSPNATCPPGRAADPACASALLRLPTVTEQDGPARRPGAARA